jgi:hypothetical protein|tara:strand:- start:2842 stop:3825 length:984 start_codon:yes stop_codon:yes gene_type:complete
MKIGIYTVLITLLMTSCVGTDKVILQTAVGKVNKVMVVTKSSNWLGDIGKEVRNTFGEFILGLPQSEVKMSVSQVAPNGFSSMMKAGRSILILEESDKENFTIRYNVYAKPQTIIYISAKDENGLIEQFKKHKKNILEAYREADLKFIQRIFLKDKLDDSKYKTLQNLGISLTIHDKFRTVDDTGDFLWLRHHLTSGIAKTGSNNILVYAIPLKDESKVVENILKVRDSIGKKYIPGSDPETMHMITEKAYTPSTTEAKIAGRKGFETRGKWEVKNDFMAGPFLNYTILDAKNNRLIVFEGFTYAPSVNKREFIFELEAIAKSMVIK